MMNISATHERQHDRRGVAYALAAAALFGASTPAAKPLLAEVQPVLMAGLLYLGSGIGLGAWGMLGMRIFGRRREAGLTRRDLPWLALAVLAGGVVGPALLMVGLSRTPASTSSLLLNLEGVLTAGLAWFLFHENVDRRIALGMLAILAGGVVLGWGGVPAGGAVLGVMAVVGACAAWALDNNVTRKISAVDPTQTAAIKGLAAGVTNVGVALAAGAAWPQWDTVLLAGGLGCAGYGVSLVLFVLALRHLGAARTAAYFSCAPFVGAVASVALLGERPTAWLCLAAVLMAVGVWLHWTESHAHAHAAVSHDHRHEHDEHHQHPHTAAESAAGPHSHPHEHEAIEHAHPHYPDIHHRHTH